MRIVPHVPGERDGAKLLLGGPESMGVHTAALLELDDDDPPTCFEHLRTHPAC